MLKPALKAALIITTSTIALPYAFAILAHMMYGWPRGRNKYKKALHPKKVYALGYVALQELAKVRYGLLYLQWNYFYHFADRKRIMKDLPYGSNGNFLDVYFPKDENGQDLPGDKRPVVMFVYGGTWSSGDKSSYGLLCSQVADRLKAVVCCPNYSVYPKGYVDDMVQDMVDCLSWIQNHIEDFRGDKHKIVMLGHSAGAHLCVMSILELTLKKLLHNPEAVLLSLSGPPAIAVSHQSSLFSEGISFEDAHFDGNHASNVSSNNGDLDNNQASASTTGSFYVVDEKEHEKSFVVLAENSATESHDKTEEQPLEAGAAEIGDVDAEEKPGDEDALDVTLTNQNDRSSKPEITVETVGSTELTESQKDAIDILSSVKLVIGLAGVYHIAEHYEHEAKRGIEFISNMARAMYGPDHFDRLSPTLLVAELPEKIKLPPMLLIHGDKDTTVPLISSLHLGQALWNIGCHDVSVSVLPGCTHTDICLDLMDPKRHWYDGVMNELLKGVEKYL